MSKSRKGRKPVIHPSMLTIWFMIFFGGCISPSICTDKLFLAEAELAVIIMAEAKDYSFVNQSFFVLPLTGLTFPVGVEYDPIGDQVYWTDAILHTVNRARLDGSSQEIIAQLQNVTGDSHYPYGIALNLDDEKVYWTDQYRDVIEMSNLDGTDRVVLIQTGFNAYPHAIVYSTFRRKIYWTDNGQYSKIEMANPDGTERETLVDDEVEYPFGDPTAISLDSTEQLLYWADITENSINVLNLETMEHGSLRIYNSTQHPFDLAPYGVAKYFEDIYFTDNNYNGLYNIDVPENDLFLVLELPTPVEIHIYADTSCPQPNLCSSTGKCVLSSRQPDLTFVCICDEGYTGSHCEMDINGCAPDRCMNGGTCRDGVNSYTCDCVAGFTGSLCSTNINDCAPDSCMNGGTCRDGINSYTCDCVAGFTGSICSIDINDCAPDRCMNGGTCRDGINSYTCDCVAGFTGSLCSTNINDCAPDSCMNGGTCRDGINSYTCDCVTGFTGSLCSTNINDCAPDSCTNGGTCRDGINSYTCDCVAGFTGSTCSIVVNDCGPDSCMNGGTCRDGMNSYTCNCVLGFTGSTCSIDINDCAPNSCMNGGTCRDGINSYTCDCAPGFTGSLCSTNINDCGHVSCMNGGTCRDGINSYTCDCVAGFTGSLCSTNINDCVPVSCVNGGTCIDGVNSYTCDCPPGFTGSFCSIDITKCEPNPCMNGGTCFSGIDGVLCNCIDGYTGTLCTTDINECERNPCRNGGTCRDEINTFTCECEPGYTGSTCSININDCYPSPCNNEGTCVDGINSFSCICVTGYTDSTCSTAIDRCFHDDPCGVNEVCTDTNLVEAGYYCNCSEGFSRRNDICMVSMAIGGFIRITRLNGLVITFTESLSDPQSEDYRNLEKNVFKILYDALINIINDEEWDLFITGFSAGSIVVDFKVMIFNPYRVNLKEKSTAVETLLGLQQPGVWESADGAVNLNVESINVFGDICFATPCLNGLCVTSPGDINYICICHYGYTGLHCETEVTCSLPSHPMSHVVTPQDIYRREDLVIIQCDETQASVTWQCNGTSGTWVELRDLDCSPDAPEGVTSNTIIIISVVVVGLVILSIVVLVLSCLLRNRRRRRNNQAADAGLFGIQDQEGYYENLELEEQHGQQAHNRPENLGENQHGVFIDNHLYDRQMHRENEFRN